MISKKIRSTKSAVTLNQKKVTEKEIEHKNFKGIDKRNTLENFFKKESVRFNVF